MNDERTEFLTARYDEEEAVARGVLVQWPGGSVHGWEMDTCTWDSFDYAVSLSPERALADIAAKRAILALHESWPVLVEGKPEFETSSDVADMTMRVSQQMVWLTNQEYRKRFGDEPPTSPIIRALLQPYAEHPDFDPAWRT